MNETLDIPDDNSFISMLRTPNKHDFNEDNLSSVLKNTQIEINNEFNQQTGTFGKDRHINYHISNN